MKKEDLEKQIQLIKQKIEEKKQAESLAKEIALSQFEIIENKFKELVEKNIFEAHKFLTLMNSNLGLNFEKNSETTIKLKSSPKENLPGEAEGEFLTDEKDFERALKFGKSFLSEEAFKRITSGIEWNSKLKIVTGSKPEFVILYGDYSVAEFGELKTLTAYQTWKNNPLFEDKHRVEAGYYLNGAEKNSAIAYHCINQFRELGVIESENSFIPIKIDLYGLTFNKNKEGLIYLTDKSIYSQITDLQNGNYNYSELTEYGIWIKKDLGWTILVPAGNGFYRCCFRGSLDSNAWVVNLGGSYPDGRVVRKKVA